LRTTAPQTDKISNAALIWDGGNQYQVAAPFFTIPSWWRRFFFAVLDARDVTIYTYICSQSDGFGIAYPTYQNIKSDLNISNARIIKESLDKLVDTGFLTVRRLVPTQGNRHQRNVYQRPLIEYTLRELLRNGYVDAELRPLRPRPKASASKGDQTRRNNRTIATGLFRLLGRDRYHTYVAASHDQKATTLADLLQRRVTERGIAFDRDVRPAISESAREDAERAITDMSEADSSGFDDPDNPFGDAALA